MDPKEEERAVAYDARPADVSARPSRVRTIEDAAVRVSAMASGNLFIRPMTTRCKVELRCARDVHPNIVRRERTDSVNR
jgi:hypothetical protein